MFNVSKYSTKPMLVKQSGSPLLADHHQVSDADINSIALRKSRFHGEWNYQIKPRKSN